jgi:preprotein translocase subunit SecD
MIRNVTNRILFILVIVGLSLWVDLTDQIRLANPRGGSNLIQLNTSPKLGLDLQGGLQVLLEADLPENRSISRVMK